jgi:heme a synthase
MNALSKGNGRFTFWLGVIVTLGFFAVNTIGFVDTHTGSALGCGHNWPLCNGSVIPSSWGLHTFIEFFHRAIVGLVVLLLVVFATLALKKYRQWREVKVLIGLSCGFTLMQSLLGALGVLLPHDPPAVLAVHLGVSLLAFNSVFLSTVVVGQIGRLGAGSVERSLRKPLPNQQFARWTWFATAYTFIAMYVGAFVASTGDGGSFRGWPFPMESYTLGRVFALDVLHRGLALGLLLILIRLAVMAYRVRDTHPHLYRAAVFAIVFVIMQAVSGMVLIATHLSLGAFLLHVTIVTCLFATMCYLCLHVVPQTKRKPRFTVVPKQSVSVSHQR